MLESLSVRDFALIDRMDAEFKDGLNVITGETGAGKSVIVGALSLLLGGRARGEQVRSGCDRAAVQGVFSCRGVHRVTTAAEEMGVPAEEGGFIIRREIGRDGRGACFVNGLKVPLQTLSKLGGLLAELHGQDEHRGLLTNEAHRDYLDAFAGNGPLTASYASVFGRYQAARRAQDALLEKEKELMEKKGFLEFRKKELESADLSEGREEKLVNILRGLENREKRMALATELENEVLGDLSSGTGRLKKLMAEMARIDSRIDALLPQAEEAAVRMAELARALAPLLAEPGAQDADIDALNAELAAINRLKRKYRRSETELLALLEETRRDLDLLENLDARKTESEKELKKTVTELKALGKALSVARAKKAPEFDAKVNALLKTINLAGAGFTTAVTPLPDFSPYGLDEVSFMASMNPGEPAKPLARIASGGELSRVMLSIKSVLAERDPAQTLVFDEVDSGIGGETAVKTGLLLKKLSRCHQVFCVTHLHQIAKEADHHCSVTKERHQGRTLIRIRELDEPEKISELARMLGDGSSEESLTHARTLLKGV